MPSSVCLGATLTDICKNKQHICCVINPELTTENSTGENEFLNLNKYLKFVKNTDRNKMLYYLLKKSIDEASINTCHGVAAFFSQILGETNELELFEEPITSIRDKKKFSMPMERNEHEIKYRGRGVLMIRGEGEYLNATLDSCQLLYFFFKILFI
jgi:predicted chitinase